MFDVLAACDRHGTPRNRANWPLAMDAFAASGVPNAGDPDRMSTFDVNAP